MKVMSIVGHSKMATTDEYLRLSGVDLQGETERLGYDLPEKFTDKDANKDTNVVSLLPSFLVHSI